ncbi:MAG: peptidylprolyl isomerase [Candidatus Rokuibacteriota bacterium]|nr:MAG: peptidylprolyl isomerase [Candidatus Rokubacteria bacterium]PYN56849.1 MAG: peptidylprolyl isomerase [Candidatus Rokubacteria bacterium]
MPHVLRSILALVLGAALAAPALAQELKTDEQKTLYALGLILSQNLASFNLGAADLDAVKAGITDGVLKKDPKVPLSEWGPRIQGLQASRLAVVAAAERKSGEAFLAKAAAEKGATKTASGLIITTLTAGTGPAPQVSDTVKVHYQGTLADGTVFDSSVQRGEPITLPLAGGIIKCWSEGVPLMKVGGKSRLVCPPDLAYGDQGRPPRIKPGATLVFEIEVLEIVKEK